MRTGKFGESEESKKELGLTRGVMNSIALFMYHRDYPKKPNAVDAFNEWATACGAKFERADEVCAVLEYVRKLTEVDRKDLEKAVEMDGLLVYAEAKGEE